MIALTSVIFPDAQETRIFRKAGLLEADWVQSEKGLAATVVEPETMIDEEVVQNETT